ncbi:MAG: DUF1266 domain-containing protein [Zoogloeaceae bacterium]|jgi:hypothetical protein|nr:DUF1266 domain-containing protein [Zoogloeaceae bacterium]
MAEEAVVFAKPSAYAPRNALNAGPLKADIARRSAARGDSEEVRAWLVNHFFRHLVANFEPAAPIDSLDAARVKLAPAAVPEWLEKQWKCRDANAVPLVWIDPAEPQLLALETRLVEFLNARRGTALEGKLARVNCPQALALWEKEHAAMAEKIERGWRQSNPAALAPLLLPQQPTTAGGVFVELLPDTRTLRAEMAFESYAMRHCLGQFADRKALTGGYGASYAEAIEAGKMRVFSFRSGENNSQPHITMSLHVDEHGALRVDQVKGKQNRPPVERYVDDLIACLNHLDANADHGADDIPDDCARIGVVRTPEDWRRIEAVTDVALQTRLIVRHPLLFPRVTNPAPLLEWLVAAREPRLFAQRPPQSPAARYALQGATGGIDEASGFQTEGVPWPGMTKEAAQYNAACLKADKVKRRRRKKKPLDWTEWGILIALFMAGKSLGLPVWALMLAVGCFFFKRAVCPEEGVFSERRAFALALALPVVDAQKMTGFFEPDTPSLTDNTIAQYRSAFLHYMECRATASDDEARAHLAATLESTWFRADLHNLLPADEPRIALAFAIVRMAFFVRNALLMGWIEHDAAWRALLLNARRAQDCFTGWGDFARAYLQGREQWVSAFRADPLGSFSEAALYRLLGERLWLKTPWPGLAAFEPKFTPQSKG